MKRKPEINQLTKYITNSEHKLVYNALSAVQVDVGHKRIRQKASQSTHHLFVLLLMVLI